MVYPERYYEMKKEMTREELNQICQKTHEFLSTPPFSQRKIEEFAMNFLKFHRPLKGFEEFKKQLVNYSKGDIYWWRWEDKNYKYYSLPEGYEITGLPPTIQVGFSRGRQIVNYINNITFFESIAESYDQK